MGKKEWFDKLSSMEIVPLKDGDFIVLRSKLSLSPLNVIRTRERMETFLADIGHPEIKVLVLGPEMEMKVVRPEAADSTVKAGYG